MDKKEPLEISLKRSKGASFLSRVQAFILGITKLPFPRFVPLSVPYERRRQMFWMQVIFGFSGLCLLIPFIVIYYMYWLYISYLTYVYFDQDMERGGRLQAWARNLSMWKHLANYFPMKIVREKELDPTKKYLFAYHPHGIIAGGAALGFGTEALGISKIFPGIEIHPLTLKTLFLVPVFRELMYSIGICAVTKRSINHLFNQGKSCLIVPGGAEGALIAKPFTANLVLKTRCGFIRMAIKNGANLVPVYAFGENDMYDTIIPEPGSILHRLQSYYKKMTRWGVPLVSGRTFFTYNYGLLPKREPLTIVVGPPILIEMDPNPSNEKVAQIHQQYKEAIKDLYDRNKEKYSNGPIIPELRFV